jgi:hypothetical protein
MGSSTRQSLLDTYIQKNEAHLLTKYTQNLLGKKVESLINQTSFYFVEGIIMLDNQESYPVHFCWSDEDKTSNEQICEMSLYYDDIIGKEITKVQIGNDREVVYVYVYVSHSENVIEIPVYQLE